MMTLLIGLFSGFLIGAYVSVESFKDDPEGFAKMRGVSVIVAEPVIMQELPIARCSYETTLHPHNPR